MIEELREVNRDKQGVTREQNSRIREMEGGKFQEMRTSLRLYGQHLRS